MTVHEGELRATSNTGYGQRMGTFCDGDCQSPAEHAAHTRTGEKPSMRRVMEALSQAGAEGIRSPDIARTFTIGDVRSNLSWVNILLSRALRDGRARRGEREPAVGHDGRVRSAYRWFITARGQTYVHPPRPPQITSLGEYPSAQRVLEILKEAGEEGMRGPDIARHFTIATPRRITATNNVLQRKMSQVNGILDRKRARGYVTRSAATEPSPHYNNVPSWRWFITGAGVEYLAGGCAPGRRARQATERQRQAAERAARARRTGALITDAYVRYDSAAPPCVREPAIRELHEQGCTLDAIGGVFGLSRERVRQILLGVRVGRCRCPEHRAGDD